MTNAELEVVGALLGLVFTGTFTLVGLRMFLTYRAKRLGSGGAQLDQLTEAVDDLRRDLAQTRVELSEVHERIDFAERLLARGRGPGHDDDGT